MVEERDQADDGTPARYNDMDKVALGRADGFAILIANVEVVEAVIAAVHGRQVESV